jgi:hypothetical protein
LFTNYGELAITVPDNKSFRMQSPFDNHGVVNVDRGTLEIFSHGSHTGVFNHAVHMFIKFMSGNNVLLPESNMTRGQGIIFAGGNTEIRGTFESLIFYVQGGITAFNNGLERIEFLWIEISGGKYIIYFSHSLNTLRNSEFHEFNS